MVLQSRFLTVLTLCVLVWRSPSRAADALPAASEHIQRGIAALLGTNYAGALHEFELANAADPENSSESLMWEGVAEEYLNQTDQATSFLESSIKANNAKPAEIATAMDVYAALLSQHHRDAEARGFKKRAIAIRKKHVADEEASGVPDHQSIKIEQTSDPNRFGLENLNQSKHSSSILLSIVVGRDGRPHDIGIVRGLGLGLDQKAVDAISRWRFTPGKRNGQAVDVKATIEVNMDYSKYGDETLGRSAK